MRLTFLSKPRCVFCFVLFFLVWFFLWLHEKVLTLLLFPSSWKWRFLYSYKVHTLLILCRGVVRHCNYLGDISVAFSCSLPYMWHEVDHFAHARMSNYMWPMAFLGHPPSKFQPMSLNMNIFTCENHQLLEKMEKKTIVGWRLCAILNDKIICRWILMNFQL